MIKCFLKSTHTHACTYSTPLQYLHLEFLYFPGASKFAPHLEKCLGMGRTSSRLAHKKTPVSVESEEDHSEDNEEDWTYPEKKCKERERES